MLRMAGSFSDRVDRSHHNQVDTELPEFGTRSARVAVGAVAWLQSIGPHKVRVHGERQRSVGEPGMRADFLLAVAPACQQPAEFALAGPVIFLDAVDTDRLPRPFLVQPVRDRFLVLLIRTVIAEKDYVAELSLLETTRGIFENLVEGLFWYGDRPGKSHMSGRRG